MPLSEYIRKRKLTLAAIELQNYDVKAIDLAVKYGYADSFTRAFVRQHGVTPTVARKIGVKFYFWGCVCTASNKQDLNNFNIPHIYDKNHIYVVFFV
jgi:AraC-like DNA-binding protein